MKLVINYDLISKIRDSKEEFKFRVVRKRFKSCLNWSPIWFSINLLSYNNFNKCINNTAKSALTYMLLILTAEILMYKSLGDTVKQDAITTLKKLSNQLADININTSFDLLQEVEEYKTDYEMSLNKKRLPQLLQKKYIMLPTYNNGDIKNTSVLQEHVIGSRNYVLSLGSPTKVYKPALTHI